MILYGPKYIVPVVLMVRWSQVAYHGTECLFQLQSYTPVWIENVINNVANIGIGIIALHVVRIMSPCLNNHINLIQELKTDMEGRERIQPFSLLSLDLIPNISHLG